MPIETKIHIMASAATASRGSRASARICCKRPNSSLGSEPTLNLVPELAAARIAIGPNLPESRAKHLETHLAKSAMVVVASGDPLFYGVAQLSVRQAPARNVSSLAHVSSMQLAFARIKESWEEAYLDQPGDPFARSVLDRIRTAETIGHFHQRDEGRR